MTSPFSTPPGGPGQPPRSTPIPGAPPPIPAGAFGNADTMADPIGGAVPPPAPPGIDPSDPFGNGGYAPPRRRRSGVAALGVIVALVVFGGLGLGIFMAVKGASTANDAVDQANKAVQDALDNTKPGLSDKDKAALADADTSSGSDNGTRTTENVGPEFLWDRGAAGALAKSFDDGIAGTPTRFIQILIYDDYASATAQDPVKKDHVDSYNWRSGSVSAPSPQQNQDDLEGRTFGIADVPWDKLQALMAQAELELKVEGATTRYFIIDKNSFGDSGLVIRAYVSGPRSSGYVAADATATITDVYD